MADALTSSGQVGDISGLAMPKRFSPMQLMSMSFALLATWNGFGSAVGNALQDASTAGSIWSLILAAFMMTIVALGMAELSSAYPFPGAQYYWSYAVSRPDWAPFASYLCANIGIFGWWLGLAATSNFVASMILAIVSLWCSEYVPDSFHTWMIYIAVVWSAVFLNTFGSRLVPSFNKMMLYFSICSLFATIAVLLASAWPELASFKSVVTDAKNRTGWSDSYGLILCTSNAIYGFLGLDGGAQMCEEIFDPAINLPKATVVPVLIGFATALPYSLTLMFVMSDLEDVLRTRTNLPLIEIYYQATGSKSVSTALLAVFAFSLFGCACGNVTSSSRQIWSVALDDCLPLSVFWKRIHAQWQMPANAAFLTGIVVSVYGLLFVYSSTAFSSMVAANVIFMTLSYTIPQAILVWRGRLILPSRYLDLGSLGSLINTLSCLWVATVVIASCLPTQRPVTMKNMNWVSFVCVSIFCYILVAWKYWQRRNFRGPTYQRGGPQSHHRRKSSGQSLLNTSARRDWEYHSITSSEDTG